ncbi:hypothetical protein SEPCBS119000_004516 [Sporothrix epigloea]|uniref:Uncharacterized protein n=1 Tax=Sporothrix epigloea TaxID=1892477 RepID=A0ABP0DVF4_9PEZI
MPIRNPFARRTTADNNPGQNGPASPAAADLQKQPSFERVDTVGSMASSSTSVRSRRSQDTGDYKMSIVNDSGVYLPPSPTSERDAFWSSSNSSGNGHRRTYITSLSSLSRQSIDNATASPTGAGRSSLGDIEPFTISRASFDSYRRSFDISAKSPISPTFGSGDRSASGGIGRQSLDSATWRPKKESRNGSSMRQTRFPPADEGFEDVGLDEGRQQQQHQANSQSNFSGNPVASVGASASNAASNFIKKRGAFFKFGSDNAAESAATRKRGQSGQGAELKPMERETGRPLESDATASQQQEAQA